MLPPGHMPFHPAFKAAVALCRTIANVARAREHTEMCSSIVQDTALRYPNMLAHELTINHLNSTLTANMRARPRLETASVFQTAAPAIARAPPAATKWAPKVLRVRSADANPKAPCEIHPDAKVPHSNGECRQNLANKKARINERTTKLMMLSEEINESSSDLEEIYQFENGNFFDEAKDNDGKRKRDDEGFEPRSTTSAVADYFATREFSQKRNGHVIDTHDDDSSDDGLKIFQDSDDENIAANDENDEMLQLFLANNYYCGVTCIDDDDIDIQIPVENVYDKYALSSKNPRSSIYTDLKCEGYQCKCGNFKTDYKARPVAHTCLPCECGHRYEVHHTADPNSNYRQSTYFQIEEELKRQCCASNTPYCEKPIWNDHKTAFQLRDEFEEFAESIKRRSNVEQVVTQVLGPQEDEFEFEPNRPRAEEGEVESFNWDDTHAAYPSGQGWYTANPLHIEVPGNIINHDVQMYSPTHSECDYSDMPSLMSDDSSDSD
jgi:hypothetical protein